MNTRYAKVAIGLILSCAVQLGAHPPTALVTDGGGNVYFAYWGGTWKLGANGQLSKIHANDFHFLAIDNIGGFANSDTPLLRITSAGSRPALFAFSDYQAVFHTDGYLYLAPWSVGRIRLERMRPGGSKSVFVDAAVDPRIARKGGRHEGGVLAIASGPNGMLYVSDGASIWTVSSQGAISPLAQSIVVPGCATDLPAELPKPHIRSLAVTPTGDVYAAAIGCRAVLRVAASGQITPILRAESPWSPCAVAVANGDMYVMEYDNPLAERPDEGRPRIRKLARDGRVSSLAVLDKAPRR